MSESVVLYLYHQHCCCYCCGRREYYCFHCHVDYHYHYHYHYHFQSFVYLCITEKLEDLSPPPPLPMYVCESKKPIHKLASHAHEDNKYGEN